MLFVLGCDAAEHRFDTRPAVSMMTLRVVFIGRVQGVGFRAFVAGEAERIGIGGWVRNRRDGTVEAVFFGTAADVEAAIAVCRKGFLGSRVDGVEVQGAAADILVLRGDERFAVLPTL
jgi:acylphosphatase